jgi:Zn-dependent M28 family amino/carboxypeptidase
VRLISLDIGATLSDRIPNLVPSCASKRDVTARRLMAPLVLVALLACAQVGASQPSPSGPGARLETALDFKRIRADLVALQRIADANGGNRAAGTRGYAASVRYVRQQLTKAGYRARITSFPFVEYAELAEAGRQVTPESRSFRVEAIDYSPSTPSGGVRARVATVDNLGCEATDYGAVRGAIALARRGTCFIAAKARHAAAAGAVALVVFNVDDAPLDATLGLPGASAIPVVAVEPATAQLLAAGSVTVELNVRTRTRRTTSQNVVADLRPGAARVLMAGAHLDSVVAGPGINDNGTGVATVLEIARVARKVAPRLRLRFAFWGAEELGLFGSSAYALSTSPREIAAYLNFDMLGSNTLGREVYAGPFAARWLAYFAARGIRATQAEVSGRSDHAPFAQRGIPVGGLFAGIDACYHARCDRVANVDFQKLRELAAAAAFGVAQFAPRA